MNDDDRERKYPFADLAITRYISTQIDLLRQRKSQKEIAKEMGYDRANIISMFKRGETRVPLDKIPQLAKALHVDVRHLYRLAMEEYWPEERKTLEDIIGTTVSANEYAIIEEIRCLTNNSDVPLTPEIKKRLKEVFKERAV